ncbi:MAG: FapA family protein [Proteobacteria bacterium]|nr:FapA family protein [Pseudomonadota bacterium]
MNTTEQTRIDQTRKPLPLIASIAVKQAFITKDQLKRALMLQDAERGDGKETSLPEILAKTGMVTPEKMLKLHTLVKQYTEQKTARSPDAEKIIQDRQKAPRVDYLFDVQHHRRTPPEFSSNGHHFLSDPPLVKDGDLLAEKHPSSSPEIDVEAFGNASPTMRSGKGAEVFEDKLKVFATIGGVPYLSIEGSIEVFPRIMIDKDYGVGSGPVERDSCISTSGTITGEYPIQGGSISSNEIRDARIDVLGSVQATIGITRSVIKAQGDIRARYIRGCRIETYGSVFVENEIMDSTIRCSGVCVCENSKIVASTIAAQGGIKAMGIGTETSVPCDITVGAEIHIQTVLGRLGKKIEQNKEWIKNLGETSINLAAETKHIHQQIAPLMAFHKKAEQAIQVTQAQIDALKKKQQKHLDEEKSLNDLKTKDKSALVSIRTFSDRLKEIQHESRGIPEEIQTLEQENERLILDRSSISTWSKTTKASARLEVHGHLFEGTEIKGPHASLVIEKNYENILAQESARPGENGEEWVIAITKLP